MKVRAILIVLLTTLSFTAKAQSNDVLSVEWKNRTPNTSLGGKAGVIFIGESNDYVITSSDKSDGECQTPYKIGDRYEYRMTINLNGKKNVSRTFTVTKRGTPYQGKSEQKDVVADFNSTYIIAEVNTKIGSNESVSDGTYLMEKGNTPVLACIEITVPQDLNLNVNVNKALNAEISKTAKAGNIVYSLVFDTRRFSQLQAVVNDLNKQLSELEAKANSEKDENVKKQLWAQQDRIQDTLLVQAEADLANAAVITIEGKGVNTLTIDPSKVRNLRPKAQLLYGVVVVEKEVIKERALTFEEALAVAKDKYKDYPKHIESSYYDAAREAYDKVLAHKDCPLDVREVIRAERDTMASLRRNTYLIEAADAKAKQFEKEKGFNCDEVYKYLSGELRFANRILSSHPEITGINDIKEHVLARLQTHPKGQNIIETTVTKQRETISGTISFKNEYMAIPFQNMRVFATSSPKIKGGQSRKIANVKADGTYSAVKPDGIDPLYIYVTGEKDDAHYVPQGTTSMNIIVK